MQNHQNLRVWQRAHALTVCVVKCTERGPSDAGWLIRQLRRAAASIGANISEGAGQETSAQFGRFLVVALASPNEVLNHAAVARDIGHLSGTDYTYIDREVEAIRAMLTVLLRRVREREARTHNASR